ncbi:hypothetical protein K9M06_04575 [Candidatus Bipolaricaulota bacterium]|nr:hypothetical protein [Candidatus Bipolaricaulota bacterium]
MGIRSLLHRLRGRTELFQIYSNITYSTPERCLEHHGEIVADESEVPEISGCDFEVLSFSVGEIDRYEEKKERMEELVEEEIERRELFQKGARAIKKGELEEAEALLERSVKLDVFLPEIEDLHDEYGHAISEEAAERLKDLFVLGYKEKFGQKRYERLPEKMREERKKAGLEKIKDLFA